MIGRPILLVSSRVGTAAGCSSRAVVRRLALELGIEGVIVSSCRARSRCFLALGAEAALAAAPLPSGFRVRERLGLGDLLVHVRLAGAASRVFLAVRRALARLVAGAEEGDRLLQALGLVGELLGGGKKLFGGGGVLLGHLVERLDGLVDLGRSLRPARGRRPKISSDQFDGAA